MEKEIKIAAKIYECMDSAKSLCKMQEKDYKETLKPYKEIIEKVMDAKKLEPIDSILLISKSKTYNEGGGVNQMFFMAALAEILEQDVVTKHSK